MKCTDFFADTFTSSPVRGFRPFRASYSRIEKLPKPRSSIRSSVNNACFIESNTALTIASARFFGISIRSETRSINSDFVIQLLASILFSRSKPFYSGLPASIQFPLFNMALGPMPHWCHEPPSLSTDLLLLPSISLLVSTVMHSEELLSHEDIIAIFQRRLLPDLDPGSVR